MRKYTRKHQFSHKNAWEFQVQLNTLKTSPQITGTDSFLPPFAAGYQRQHFAPAYFIKALAAQTHTVQDACDVK